MIKFGTFNFIRFFFNHCVKNYYGTLGFVSFASLYWALDIQFRHWIFKTIIDRFETVPKESSLAMMMPWIYMYIVCLIIRFGILRFSSYLRMYYVPNMKTNLMKFLSNEVVLKSNLLEKKDLDIISNQIQEILKNFETISSTIFIEVFAHLVLLSSSIFVFYQNSFLLYGLFSLYCSFFLISYLGYVKGVQLNSSILSFDMKLFSRFNDIFANLLNIKLLNNASYEQQKLNEYYNEFASRSMKKDFWQLIIIGLLSLLFISYHCFCIIFLLLQYQNGVLSKADFPYIIAINRDVTESLWYIVDDFIKLSEAVGKTRDSLEKIFSDTLMSSTNVKKIKLNSYDIEFDNISFGYPGDKEWLFNNLSLKIKEGSKMGIVGYSGSGKSSLASLILNLAPLKSGSIKIGEQNLNGFSQEQLYSLITFMNQDLSLFNRTIKENIMYGKLNATEEEIIHASKMANIHDFIESLPDKYETLLKYRGQEFSYGQKQRILIARAFLRDTPILILDEITSALDSKSENMVMESLYKLMKNKTVIVIAHKLKTLLNMDYIITLNDGKILEVGTHEELLQKKTLYYELFNN